MGFFSTKGTVKQILFIQQQFFLLLMKSFEKQTSMASTMNMGIEGVP